MQFEAVPAADGRWVGQLNGWETGKRDDTAMGTSVAPYVRDSQPPHPDFQTFPEFQTLLDHLKNKHRTKGSH